MAMKYREVGGGAATGLSEDFIGMLRKGLQTGSFGSAGATSQAGAANPVGDTTGIAGILNDLLAGGAGKIGGATANIITKQAGRDVADLRSRFGAGGGTAFGTGSQYAESVLRSETAPKLATAVGGLQEGALNMLLPLLANLSGKGIAQRETIAEQNPWASAAQVALPVAGSVLGFLAGGSGGAAVGSKVGSSLFGSGGTPSLGSSPAPFQIDWNQRFKDMGL